LNRWDVNTSNHERIDARQSVFTAVRDETAALTEQTGKIEREIDERLAELYGL